MSRLPLRLSDQSLGPTWPQLHFVIVLLAYEGDQPPPTPEERAALGEPEPQHQLVCSCKLTSKEHHSNLNAHTHTHTQTPEVGERVFTQKPQRQVSRATENH